MHLIELVDTLPGIRYWSDILHCIFPTPLIDRQVKIRDLRNFIIKFLVKVFKSLYLLMH